MGPQEWSPELPNEEGWYWRKAPHGEPCIEELVDYRPTHPDGFPGGTLCWRSAYGTEDLTERSFPGSLWSAKLTPPPMPTDAPHVTDAAALAAQRGVYL